MTESLWIS